jgi:hypothetical protein
MYRLLSQDRSPLPDVPAVYFVEPTSENIKKICEVWIRVFGERDTAYLHCFMIFAGFKS